MFNSLKLVNDDQLFVLKYEIISNGLFFSNKISNGKVSSVIRLAIMLILLFF
jgi:hypothetical protein